MFCMCDYQALAPSLAAESRNPPTLIGQAFFPVAIEMFDACQESSTIQEILSTNYVHGRPFSCSPTVNGTSPKHWSNGES
jgi:hypothetical protein